MEALIWQSKLWSELEDIRRCIFGSSEDANFYSSEDAYQTLIKSSESRFVRRTFSASMIILWHSKSWRNQSYPQNSDVCTIVRTLYLIWIKRFLQDWSHTRLPDLDIKGTIYSWRNLTAKIQIKHATPSSINWSKFEALGYETGTILKRAVTLPNSS